MENTKIAEEKINPDDLIKAITGQLHCVSLLELSKNIAGYALETYKDELLRKALNISIAIAEFEAELHFREAK